MIGHSSNFIINKMKSTEMPTPNQPSSAIYDLDSDMSDEEEKFEIP